MSGTADKLMDLAEVRMRDAGYHGFSFREIASELGIKSASVHHHFPTKVEMVVAVMQRYHERFAELVAEKPGESADDAVEAYRSVFRSSLCDQGGMCLSGMLGAESGGLPDNLMNEVKQFFKNAVDDLSRRIGGADSVLRAHAILATLEGGLILARAYRDVTAFDKATESLTTMLFNPDHATAHINLAADGSRH